MPTAPASGPFLTRAFPLDPAGASSYEGSVNMMVLGNQWAVPAFDQAAISTTDLLHYCVAAVEVKSPNGTPRIYFAINKSVIRYEDGAFTTDTTFNDVIQGMAVVDDGDTPGSAILLCTFGTGFPDGANPTFQGTYWRDLGTDTTPWTAAVDDPASAGVVLTAWQVQTVGSDTYAVTGGGTSFTNGDSQGRTTLVERHVSLLPSGLDPLVAANWGAGEPVGQADYPITALAPLQGNMVVGKGDGAYVRDSLTKEWKPVLDRVRYAPNAVNCKGMAAIENGVAIPLENGSVFFYDGVNAHDISPFKGKTIPKDGRRPRISAIADLGGRIAMYAEANQTYLPGPRASDVLGLRVFTYINGTYTEITSGVVDGSNQTPASANMNGWGGHSGDELIFIVSEPVEGFILNVTRHPNSADNSFTSPVVSNGASGFSSLGTVLDGTILSTSGKSLQVTGFPAGASQAVLRWQNINGFDTAQLDTITINLEDITGYIYKFSPRTTTAMTSTTTIDQVHVIEGRAGLPIDATMDFTHVIRAGCCGEIFMGDRVGAADFAWSNPIAVHNHGGVQAMLWTSCATGTVTNGGYGLMLIGRYARTLIAEGRTHDPLNTPYPRLCQFTTTEPGPTLALRSIQLSEKPAGGADPSRLRKITKILVHGDYIQPADVVGAFVDWNDGRVPQTWASGQGGPLELVCSDPGVGMVPDVYVTLADSAQKQQQAPRISAVDLIWEYASDPFTLPKHAAAEIPVLV